MLRSSPKLFSFPEILSSELQAEILLALPPKEILRICSEVEGLKRGCSQYKFWERVWLIWVSSRLPNWSSEEIKNEISRRVEEARRLTPVDLLIQGSLEGILFYVIEAHEQGVNVSFLDDWALRRAAANGHFEIVRYLVEVGGANISALEDEAFRLAARNGHLDVVRYLVERGANIFARENEALRRAAANGHLDVVKYLVESGADISARDNEALREAEANGHLDIVKYLLSKEADRRVLGYY
jgi:ankyrin repeat protein